MNHEWHLRGSMWTTELKSLIRRVCSYWVTVVLVFGVLGCAPRAVRMQQAQYAVAIVGGWQGTVGDMKETMTFSADGKFVSHVRPMGFISNTLGQGVTGTIRGTWVIKDKDITLRITNSENERLLNKATSSTIVKFTQNEIVVKSASGETSTFVRTFTL